MKISYEDLYEEFIWRFHMKIWYKNFIWKFYTELVFEDFICRFYLNILYEEFISMRDILYKYILYVYFILR